MQRISLAALVGLALAAASPAAHAADLRSPPPYATPVPEVLPNYAFNWTGLYLGIHGGWRRFDGDLGGGRGTLSSDTVFGGLQGGFNYQLPSNIVLGLEADVSFGDQSDTWAAGTEAIRGTLDWTGSFRARLGYAFDRLLIYGTGGIAWANYDVRFTDVAVPATTTTSDTLFGWTVGLGAEYAITNNLTFGAQYRFTDYDVDNLRAPGGGRVKHDLDTHDVRLGLNWKF